MVNPSNDIPNGLNQITDWVKTWALLLGAIGAISMALLEAAKTIFPLRARFQRKHILKWLQERSQECTTAENDLIKIATDGDEDAFYNSDIEDVCQRIKAAVPVILDYPDEHRALLECLANEANPTDVALLLEPPPC